MLDSGHCNDGMMDYWVVGVMGFDGFACLMLHVGLGVILRGAQLIEVSVVLKVE